MVLFVDETDAFLRRRAADELISENLRSAINTFLYRTGSPSNKIMVILATNCPEALDEAVQDRIDEIVFLDRPSTPERLSILYLYLLQYCEMNHISRETKSKFRSLFFKNKKINAEGLTDEYMNEVAVKTEGFSGRELNKLVISWYDEVVAKEIPVLNKEIANLVLDRHIEQNKTKNKWNFIQKNYFDKLHSNKL
jgi:ATPase family AAA domain-containing protein 3A/B